MYISEPAEYAILGLLESQPMHGYEMFQQFKNGALGQIVHLEMSQMYAFLKKLERLKYIEAQLEAQGPRPPRKIFRLTEQGRLDRQDVVAGVKRHPELTRWRQLKLTPLL